MTSTTRMPASRYDSTAAGPVWLITAPEPTNNPAPITPPSEIIVTWRRLSPLWSPPLSSMPEKYPHIAVIHHLRQPFLGHAAAPLGRVQEHFGTLPSLDEVDAIVSLGGEQAAWEPALDAEAELLREAVAREIPVLGVCLGAQLLSRALG